MDNQKLIIVQSNSPLPVQFTISNQILLDKFINKNLNIKLYIDSTNVSVSKQIVIICFLFLQMHEKLSQTILYLKKLSI